MCVLSGEREGNLRSVIIAGQEKRMSHDLLTAADVADQVRRHADSWRSAGVEFVSIASPPMPSSPAPPDEPRTTPLPMVQSSLFATEVEESNVVSLTVEQRREQLRALAAEVAQCMRCPELAATRTQTVFGVGAIDPDVCFVGEAPGANEDAQGEPFVGEAGQLLNRIIAACGMKREEVFICNVLRCRPPSNRTPTGEEAENCRPFLEKTLELVRPRFICALGAPAAQTLLGTRLGIGKLRGRFHDFRGIPVLCTYHPAFLLPTRSPHKKKDVWDDMKLLLARMGRPIPGK
jgi:DNA polymerase